MKPETTQLTGEKLLEINERAKEKLVMKIPCPFCGGTEFHTKLADGLSWHTCKKSAVGSLSEREKTKKEDRFFATAELLRDLGKELRSEEPVPTDLALAIISEAIATLLEESK